MSDNATTENMIANIPTETIDEKVIRSSELISQFLSNQKPDVVENWKRIVAMGDKDAMKCLMVTEEIIDERIILYTANIANERILVRTPLPYPVLPGGYLLSQRSKKKPTRNHWSGYPMVSEAKPDFKLLLEQYPKLKQEMFMPREACGSFATFCQQVHQRGGSVILSKDGAFARQDNTFRWEYPFRLLQNCEINALYCSLAFIEALRYDGVYVVRQYDDSRCMPLFIGKDWGNCILVSTLRSHTSGMYSSTTSLE